MEHLVNRLERLLDRLERTVLARELNFASEALDLRQEAINNIKSSSTLSADTNNQQPITTIAATTTSNNQKNCNQHDKNVSNSSVAFTQKLEQRISELESNLDKRIVEEAEEEEERESNNVYGIENFNGDNIIPTVVSQIVVEQNSIKVSDGSSNHGNIMSLNGYEDIISGYLNPFLELSKKIGGDVATQAELVRNAFK